MKKLSASLVLLGLVALAGSATAGWTYKTSVFAPAVKASTRGVATLKIETSADFTLDTETPPRISIISPEGIEIEKEWRAPKDLIQPGATATGIDIAFTAPKKGKYSMTATVDFAVCTTRLCEPASEVLAFDIDVQ